MVKTQQAGYFLYLTGERWEIMANFYVDLYFCVWDQQFLTVNVG